MRVVTCAKQVPDSTVVKYDIVSKTLTNVSYILDPIDEIALSEAIRIREKNGGEVTAITLGPRRAEEVLRTCLKMGADRAIHLLDEDAEHRDPTSIAAIVAKHIGRLPYDVILCGNQSMDQGNGYVGVGIAEELGLPVCTAVTRVDIFADTRSAVVHRRLKAGNREIVETPLPAVFTVETVLSKPIYPKLRTILTGRRKPIDKVDVSADTQVASGLSPAFGEMTVTQPKPRLKKTASIPTGGSAGGGFFATHERMKLIASGGVQDKGSKVVKKPPAQAADEIIEFLISHGIVARKD